MAQNPKTIKNNFLQNFNTIHHNFSIDDMDTHHVLDVDDIISKGFLPAFQSVMRGTIFLYSLFTLQILTNFSVKIVEIFLHTRS
jgi:hypothetical protein